MYDADIVAIMDLCKRVRITVHVRGTDANPVIVLKDKRTRANIGWVEVKRREELYWSSLDK